MSELTGKIGLYINDLFIRCGKVFLNCDGYRLPILEKIKKIRKEGKLFLNYQEAMTLYFSLVGVAKIKGAVAEVGVYTGGSAKLLCEAKQNKDIYLFDTFQGLPQVTKYDQGFRKGEYTASFEAVASYLHAYKKVYIHKGLFPKSAESIKKKRFSFVHLDVDLYNGTKDALTFFYPRMNKGGVILSHDFGKKHAVGVKKAFDEFFKNKPEPVFPLTGTQCIVVKL